MTTLTQVKEFRAQLAAMPHNELVEALAEYASSDPDFFAYFSARILLSNGRRSESLAAVIAQIDRVYGDDEIPGSLDWGDSREFEHVQELISQLIERNFAPEAIKACEHAFGYVENISTVHWPDDFVFDCYDTIVRTWLKALRASGLSDEEIATRVQGAIDDDGYGLFSDVEKLCTEVLGLSISE